MPIVSLPGCGPAGKNTRQIVLMSQSNCAYDQMDTILHYSHILWVHFTPINSHSSFQYRIKHVLNYFGRHINYVFAVIHFSHWNCKSDWNCFSWMTNKYLPCVVNIMVADDLMVQLILLLLKTNSFFWLTKIFYIIAVYAFLSWIINQFFYVIWIFMWIH